MLITDHDDLLEIEQAFSTQARRHREYAAGQPPLRANQFRFRAERLEALRLRLLEEHFPKAFASEQSRES